MKDLSENIDYFSLDINKFIEDELERNFFNHFVSQKENHYKVFKIPKRSNGYREINQPIGELKLIHKKISNYLLIHRNNNLGTSYGFEFNKSILECAIKHVNKRIVINFDIKDFFNSISKEMVHSTIQNEFKITNENLKYLTEIVTFREHLPQGSPCSPILSNYICHSLDIELLKYAKQKKLVYTRYADDLTFSTNDKVNFKEFIVFIINTLKSFGFGLNFRKLKIYKKNNRQEVTGLVVNEKVNVKRELLKLVRAVLYNWKKNGYTHAEIVFKKKFPNNNLINTLGGWIDFIGFIKGKENTQYQKFLKLFNTLVNNTNKQEYEYI